MFRKKYTVYNSMSCNWIRPFTFIVIKYFFPNIYFSAAPKGKKNRILTEIYHMPQHVLLVVAL